MGITILQKYTNIDCNFSTLKVAVHILLFAAFLNLPINAQDDDKKKDEGNSAQVLFEPFIYTSVLNGKPYLQITIKAVGKIDPSLDSVTYHDQKNQMTAAMLTIIARLAKKKFRVGQPLDPDLISVYLQSAVDKTVNRKDAVKIYVIQAEQKPLN